MGWLPMYLYGNDVDLLREWLNQEEQIAYLVSNGPKKWVAKNGKMVAEAKTVGSEKCKANSEARGNQRVASGGSIRISRGACCD